MVKGNTRSEAFEHFGAECKNNRWSWSARSPDGKTVVLIFWQHEIKKKAGLFFYQSMIREIGRDWIKRPGNQERLENLKWARDSCDGLFRVVIAIAKDPTADPKEIKECFAKDKLIMRITELNEETGEFSAVSLEK